MDNQTERISWPTLFAGMIVTVFLSLSVHAVMLQGFHVPFPYNFPNTGWAKLPDDTLTVLGAIFLSAHLPRNIRKRSFGFRSALLFLLLASIREVLFRDPFMDFINLSNLTLYPFIDNLPKLIPLAVVAIGVESSILRERSFWTSLIFAVVLAAIAALLVKPLANYSMAGLMHFTSAREGHQRYGVPYDWHILMPAYLTFFEPVIAALVIGGVIRRRLPAAPLVRFGITAALIIALKGPVFAALLNIWYANTGAFTAILSYAQFTFETMALGILAAATLQLSFNPIKPALRP